MEGHGGTHLLAQIRAASSASELNCSYSSETRWQQKGNSSTEARLRPRSKMRILGSGTPRLNRDLGYGYRTRCLVSEMLQNFSWFSLLVMMLPGEHTAAEVQGRSNEAIFNFVILQIPRRPTLSLLLDRILSRKKPY